LKELKKYLDDTFSVNLAMEARASASNVRRGAGIFSASKAIDGDPETYWAADDSVTRASIALDFRKSAEINAVLIQEDIALGQRVKSFSVEAMLNGAFAEVAKGTTIGNRRIVRFGTIQTQHLRVSIEARACPLISNIEVYKDPEIIEVPVM
jgi:alpha-L-fucosidase